MGDPLKCHDLVALMHVATGTGPHHTLPRNQIELAKVQGGILDDDEGNQRTFPILDALASISVSKPIGQVVAIGLQWKQEACKVCLTIAENGKVEKSLTGYIAHVWDLLRALSIRYSVQRTITSIPAQRVQQHRRISPIIPEGVGRDLRIALFRHIYTYTREKNRQRIMKCLPALEAFMKRFYETRETELIGFERDLDLAFRTLQCGFRDYDIKPREQQDDKYWEELHAFWEIGTGRVMRITKKDISFCDDIVAQVGKLYSLKV